MAKDAIKLQKVFVELSAVTAIQRKYQALQVSHDQLTLSVKAGEAATPGIRDRINRLRQTLAAYSDIITELGLPIYPGE